MNLTDLERELDAACGGKSLADANAHDTGQTYRRAGPPIADMLQDAHGLLRDCHKLLVSLGHGDGMTLTEWHMKRVQLIERIESAVKP